MVSVYGTYTPASKWTLLVERYGTTYFNKSRPADATSNITSGTMHAPSLCFLPLLFSSLHKVNILIVTSTRHLNSLFGVAESPKTDVKKLGIIIIGGGTPKDSLCFSLDFLAWR